MVTFTDRKEYEQTGLVSMVGARKSSIIFLNLNYSFEMRFLYFQNASKLCVLFFEMLKYAMLKNVYVETSAASLQDVVEIVTPQGDCSSLLASLLLSVVYHDCLNGHPNWLHQPSFLLSLHFQQSA